MFVEPITKHERTAMSLRQMIRRDMHQTWVMKMVKIDNVKDQERFLDIVMDMANDLADVVEIFDI